MTMINRWDQWDLPAVLIEFMPWRLIAVRLIKGDLTKY